MAEQDYLTLASALTEIDALVATGPPVNALVSRNGSGFHWEQVAGRPPKPRFDMARIQAAVAQQVTRWSTVVVRRG